MRRWLFNILAAGSAVLLLASVGLWICSVWRTGGVKWTETIASEDASQIQYVSFAIAESRLHMVMGDWASGVPAVKAKQIRKFDYEFEPATGDRTWHYKLFWTSSSDDTEWMGLWVFSNQFQSHGADYSWSGAAIPFSWVVVIFGVIPAVWVTRVWRRRQYSRARGFAVEVVGSGDKSSRPA